MLTHEKNVIDDGKLSGSYKRILITSIIITFFMSSFLGAVFGFMGAMVGQQKVFSWLPGFFQEERDELIDRSDDSSASETHKLIEEESAVTAVVEKASPAVVSIIVTKDIPKIQEFFFDPFESDPFFNPFGSRDKNRNDANEGETEKREIGGGSGFIASKDGLVVTNKHVVSDQSADYTVMTNDGKKYEAQVMAIDPMNDIAILKINANNLPVLEFGDSDSLKIGQTVIAIGNSLGEFRNTVSKGIISGLKRSLTAGTGTGELETLSEVIQTDAAINPGNSGGPLLNIDGRVIGVNVAMAQGAENIGFALPVNLVKKDIDSVKSKGKIVQPFLGVRYVIVNKQIQKENNLPYDYGALILRGQRISDLAVVPGSPADKAGIVENDIILEVNGKKVSNKAPLGSLIAKYNVGDTVNLKIWHKGEEKTVSANLEERK